MIRLPAIPLLALLLLLAAQPAAAGDGDPVASPAGTAAGQAHGPLKAVPAPDLSRTEPAVRRAMQAARSQVAQRLRSGETEAGALAQAYGELGGLYLAHRLYMAAEPCYLNARRLAPDEPRWVYYLGYLYQRDNRPEQAARQLRQYLEMQPDYAPARLRLAQVYLELNRPEKAEPHLQAVRDEAGLRGAALFELGRLALQGQAYDRAIEWLQEALDEAPGAGRIHYLMAMAYRGRGDAEAARRHLAQRGEGRPRIDDPLVERLDALVSGALPQLYRGMGAMRDGHYEEAIEAFQKALEAEPENANARVTLSRAYYLSGQPDDARAALEKALEHDPDHALAHFLLGVLNAAEGEREAAASRYRQALAADPDHSGAHYYLANLLMRKDDYAAAADHYRQAVEASPENFPAWVMEALARLRAGEPHRAAVRHLEAARARHPERAVLDYVLARLLAASPETGVRDGERALKLARSLYGRYQFLAVNETVAMAQAEAGRYDKAAEMQRELVASASTMGRVERLSRLREHLQRYRQGQACREPFAPEDPLFKPPRTDARAAFLRYPTKDAF